MNEEKNIWSEFETREEAMLCAEKYARDNGSVEFNGMNCNDYLEEGQAECDGWDGFDRRCNCGNRRVSWETYENSNGKFSISAEAY